MIFVAECGPCDGDLAYALDLANSLAELNADGNVAMKVQWYNADTLTTRDAKRYDHTHGGPDTQHELFQKQLSYDDWVKVATRCYDLGLDFFPTVFDSEAITFARRLEIRTLKIASGDITHHPLIAEAARWSQRLILSTGAATYAEVEAAMQVAIREQGPRLLEITLLACHLAYPTTNRNANFGRIVSLLPLTRNVGYSDHTTSTSIAASVLATYGISMWEKHYTLKPGAGGDHDFAVGPKEMEEMMSMVAMTEHMLGNADLTPTEAEKDALIGARRSLVAAVDIPRLTKLTKEMFVALRPGTGIPPSELARITGTDMPGAVRPAQRAMVDIPAGTVIQWNMIGLVGATLSVE